MPENNKIPVAVFGNGHCHRAKLYEREIARRGIKHQFYDIDDDETARKVLESFFSDGVAKAPSLIIAGKLFRNPSIMDLDKHLARQGVYDPGIVHNGDQRRYIRHMKPTDAFVSYTRKGSKMILTHIEVPVSARGTGIGGKFAEEVLEDIVAHKIPASLTCPFLRKVANTRAEWRQHFNI